jgi:aspartokinase
MANIERLTKRVKIMEEWIEENEDVAGPAGTLETFNHLINEVRGSQQRNMQMEQSFNQLRQLAFEFIKEHELTDEWDEFVQEKENAVQKQQTEEVPLQEEAESGEEAVEAPVEEKEG